MTPTTPPPRPRPAPRTRTTFTRPGLQVLTDVGLHTGVTSASPSRSALSCEPPAPAPHPGPAHRTAGSDGGGPR
ncbi:hypothetical protein [Actinocorallia populi]|uniref:hypothetical protein n=1 Tax=Actinocorallia populi TaxID=2079200 RepID=UPI00130093AB|nr:hypothetical protein [Actinocorallia populi]